MKTGATDRLAPAALDDAAGSPQIRKLHLLLCLLVAILAAVRYWVPFNPAATLREPIEPFSIAHSLKATGDFANPFAAMPTGPSAHLAPLFPAVVAFVMKISGDGAQGAYIINLISVAAMALQVGAFPLVSASFGMGVLTGLLAALFWLVAKPPLYGSWECTLAALFLILASWLFHRLTGTVKPKALVCIALGLMMAASVLLVQTVVPVLALWIAWLAYRTKGRSLRGWTAAMVLLPVVIVGSWTIRNYFTFHRLIAVRDNLGLELAVSNNKCASYGLFENEKTACFLTEHPNVSVDEARKVIALGEPAYNDLRLRQALQWISTNPRRFASLSIKRAVAFWLPNESGNPVTELKRPGFRAMRLIVYGITALSLLGLGMLFRKDAVSAGICALWLVVFPAIYYFIQYIDRYREPVLWVSFLLGAYPLAMVPQRFFRAVNR